MGVFKLKICSRNVFRDAMAAVLPPSTIEYLKCTVLLYLLFVVHVCFVSVRYLEQLCCRIDEYASSTAPIPDGHM